MSVAPTYSLPSVPAPRQQVRILLIANFVYLLLVHARFLGAPTSAVDGDISQLLQNPNLLARGWFNLEVELFGTHYAAYRMVNLLLLYACMVGIFFLTRLLLNGPWWLGSLAAVLTMANPLKTSAFISIAGANELVPAALAIWGILLSIAPLGASTWAAQVGAMALIGISAQGRSEYLFLPLAIATLHTLAISHEASPASKATVRLKCAFWFLAQLIFKFLHVATVASHAGSAPLSLFLIAYPVGLLAQTNQYIQEYPLLAETIAYLFMAATLVFHRVAPFTTPVTITYAAFFLRLAAPPLDPVTLSGGEHMIVPIALVAIAFAALCQAAMRHPAWPRHVVFLTTLLCILFFWLQISALLGATP